MSPRRRHPTRASPVLADRVGELSLGIGGRPFHPVNHAADERGSNPPTPCRFPPVVQHVDERVPDLARRAQQSDVIAVSPDAPATLERAVDRFRQAHDQSADSGSERLRAVGFDDQVQVISLDAELADAE
jgi:hypothetical protein